MYGVVLATQKFCYRPTLQQLLQAEAAEPQLEGPPEQGSPAQLKPSPLQPSVSPQEQQQQPPDEPSPGLPLPPTPAVEQQDVALLAPASATPLGPAFGTRSTVAAAAQHVHEQYGELVEDLLE